MALAAATSMCIDLALMLEFTEVLDMQLGGDNNIIDIMNLLNVKLEPGNK